MPSFQHAPTSWHGSLFAEGLDDAGLMYRRNRYYDPATGQFTQEDPIGLSGGANLYGFAGGDPVNNKDPFGTDCPPGKAVAVCVIISIFESLGAGRVPVPKAPVTVEPRSATATKPEAEPPEGTGEMKELVEDVKKAYKKLNGSGGGEGDDAVVLRKVLSAGEADAPDVAGQAAAGASRVVGGVAGLVLMHLVDPPALGRRCSADERQHGCVDQ